MTRTEHRTFEAMVDAVCAPEPPLPPVAQTDAAVAFDRWMKTAPALNRVGLRATLAVLAVARFSRRPRAQRARWMSGPHAEPLRAAASVSYYGDREVSRIVGYAP